MVEYYFIHPRRKPCTLCVPTPLVAVYLIHILIFTLCKSNEMCSQYKTLQKACSTFHYQFEIKTWYSCEVCLRMRGDKIREKLVLMRWFEVRIFYLVEERSSIE